jgi:hypothetical protein
MKEVLFYGETIVHLMNSQVERTNEECAMVIGSVKWIVIRSKIRFIVTTSVSK